MGKKSAKSGGAAAVILKKQLDKKVQGKKAQPVESDNESEDSGNYMTFNKKNKDSDDEEDREVFNLALDKDDDDEDDESEEDDSEEDSEGSEDESEEDGSGEESESDASDDSEEDVEGDNLKQLVDNLPSKLRQQIRKKAENEKRRKAGMEVESDSGSDGEESEEQEEGWGRKKKTYWQGDTADLEIGQEMDDAMEEEEAAQELHREKTKRMKASDFMDEFAPSGDDSGSESSSSGSGSDSDESSAPAQKGGKKGASKKSSKRADAVVGDLAQVSLGQDDLASDDDAAVQVERVSKNLAHLTKQQRLDLITKNSPEMLGIVEELKDLIGDLKGRILPIKEYIKKISASHQVQDDVVDYLEVKQQLLLTYCMNVVFYLYMKAQGKSVANHPVMKQLLKLRYVMEKMRPLDGKLKHQVDRLVQLAELSPQDLSQHTDLLRPNPFALLSNSAGEKSSSKSKASSKKSSKRAVDSDEEAESEGEGSESEVEDDSDGASEAKGEVYKVPKRTAVPYKESETALDKRDKRIEKTKSKLKRSELMDTLRDEFGTAPEAAASSGLGMQSGDLRKLQEEADERRQYEEDRFVRMTMTRKDKKDIKRRTAEASRLDNFDDIGDIGDFEELSKLAGSMGQGGDMGAEDDLRGASKSSSKQSASMGSALQRAVMALAQSDAGEGGAKGSKKSNMRAMAEALGDDDSDDPYSALLAAGPGGDDGNNRKRRRAPTSSMDSDLDQDFGGNDDASEDGENLLEDFSQKKKKFLAEKKAHYTAEPKFGGFQETVQEGGKRAASYEIIKNKGLTPHRKKANRNPRVKKREMYDKAVIRRKGQVRDVVTGAAGAYAGELTGIKANVARSRKIGV